MSRIPEFQSARPIGKQPWPWYRGEGGGHVYPPGEPGANYDGPTRVVWNQLAATGEYFAIKSLSKDFLEGESGTVLAMLEAEVDAHRRISNTAVPALRDVVRDDETGQVHLVFDYGGGPIFDGIDRTCTRQGTAHNTAVAAHATATLLIALQQLHEAGYSYNDMKPQQLLWDASLEARDFPVKLTDFGAVTKIGSCELLGTTCSYMPPEAHAIAASGADVRGPGGIGSTLGPSFDVWGAVLSIATIALDGFNPFEAPFYIKMNNPEPYPRVPGCSWDPYDAQVVLEQPTAYEDAPAWDCLDPDLQDFIRAGLHPDPEERPTIGQLMDTTWGRRCLAPLIAPAAGGDDEGCDSQPGEQSFEEQTAALPPLPRLDDEQDNAKGEDEDTATPMAAEVGECAPSTQLGSGPAQQPAACQSERLGEQVAEACAPLSASLSAGLSAAGGDAATIISLLTAEVQAVRSERDDARQQLLDERLEARACMERLESRLGEMGQQLKALTEQLLAVQAGKGQQGLSRLQSGAGAGSEASDVATPSLAAGSRGARLSSGSGRSGRSGRGRGRSSNNCGCADAADARKRSGKRAGARVFQEMWGDVKAAGRVVAGWFEEALMGVQSKSKARGCAGCAAAAPAGHEKRRFLGMRSVIALV